MICDWCHNFHYNHLNLPSSYIPSEYGIKCSSLVYGCFSFRVGNLQSHCKESNYFHQIAKDVFPSEYGIKCSSLVYGCFSFRVGNLQSHCKESNYFHQIAKDVFDNITKEKTGGESEADWAKKLLSNRGRKYLPALFTYAFVIMKFGRPLTDFEFLIKLDKAKGIEVSNTYLNRRQRLEFGLAITNLLRNNLGKYFKTGFF